jgi:hypothetical protein
MWHKLSTAQTGADKIAAPLLIAGIQLRYRWQGVEIVEKGLVGKLDTAASCTVIPLHLALSMKLPSAGRQDGLKSFDQSLELQSYPKFHTELYTPQQGWMMMEVIGCPRTDVLLGLDVCKKMLLVANWKNSGFGIKPANFFHHPLRFLFRAGCAKKV